jgi:hypothetical protein
MCGDPTRNSVTVCSSLLLKKLVGRDGIAPPTSGSSHRQRSSRGLARYHFAERQPPREFLVAIAHIMSSTIA